MLRKSILFSCIFCLTFILSGCSDSSRPHDLPELQPCTLTILQENRGLAEASVMLYATDSANTKWVIAGNTDANGRVVLKTHGKFSGVPIGEYKVVITKTERVPAEMSKPAIPDSEGNIPPQPVDIYYLIEPQYTDVSATPLTVMVKKGTNTATISVGKAVREKSKIIVL
jgi:hypothetical protein